METEIVKLLNNERNKTQTSNNDNTEQNLEIEKSNLIVHCENNDSLKDYNNPNCSKKFDDEKFSDEPTKLCFEICKLYEIFKKIILLTKLCYKR